MRTLERTSLLLTVALALALLPATAGAQSPIDFDLRTWSQQGDPDWGTWEVSDDGLQVIQTINHSPTFFVSPETFGSAVIEGVIEVQTDSDDDYIGFVMGYQGPFAPDETGYDFVVFNWKEGFQRFRGCDGPEGASLLRLQGTQDPDANYTPAGQAHPALWCHESRTEGAYDIDVEILDTSWGEGTGWDHRTEYDFRLSYSPTRIVVQIDGEIIVSANGSFPEGSFGFYNYSQSDVRYSGFRQTGEDPDIAPGDPGVSRIDGAGTGDVTATSIEICDFLVPDGTADAVALARIDDFADALAGSALPVDCILFTQGGPEAPLDTDTHADIRRALDAEGTVYVLGGVNAVSDQASATLLQDGYLIRRLEGPTRYETAEAVAAEVGALLGATSPDQVIVAFGGDWADAVTVGAYAHATSTPIVLTTTDVLHPAADRVAQAVVDATPGAEVVVIGGDAVVGPAVEAALPGSVRRVDGVNRMATAVAIAEQLWPDVPATGADFVLANLERGEAWTIALASAPLAARIGGPQLGLRADSYPVETRGYLEGLGLAELPSVVLLGDVGFISDEVATAVGRSVVP